MTALRQLIVGVAVLATLVAAGAADARSVGQVIDDTAITTRIKARLAADKLSNLTNIQVTTDSGAWRGSGGAHVAAAKRQRAEGSALPGSPPATALLDASEINVVWTRVGGPR